MWSGSRSVGRSGTVTEAARRAQVIEAAIATVNELGYHHSSLARIADRAGISKSVISYHFDGKEELLRQVVDHVFGQAGEHIEAAVRAEDRPAAKLTAYVHAYLGFMRSSRAAMIAAMEIAVSHRDVDGVPLYLTESEDDTALLESIVTAGIASGEFRSVDLTVAVTTIVHALDGALTRSQMHPDTDLVGYAEHLAPLLLSALHRPSDG